MFAALSLARVSTWLGTLTGRASLIAAICLSLFTWLKTHDYRIQKKTELATIERGHAAGRALNAKGVKARTKSNSVEDPARALLRQSCRDC